MCKTKIKIQPPVTILPSYKTYGVQQYYFLREVQKLGIDTFPKTDDFILNAWYYYTDLDGWSKILPDLVLKSSLYKQDVFACDGYAIKAQVECALRYGLNSMRFCIGRMPLGMHGFDIFPYGDELGIHGLLLFEPNEGFDWAGNAFEIGCEGYEPKMVFLASRL